MKSSSHIELALLLAILLKAINSFQTRQTFIRPTISVSGNTIKSINPNPRKMSSTILQVSPKALLGEGMQKFRGGDIQGSIDLFDEVDKSASDGSLRPYLWQRGISYYYADQFKEGSDQVSKAFFTIFHFSCILLLIMRPHDSILETFT